MVLLLIHNATGSIPKTQTKRVIIVRNYDLDLKSVRLPRRPRNHQHDIWYRQLQEKCMEQHRDLYLTFVDLTKAFNTVSRDGLWKIMGKFGCPSTFIAVVRQFHDGRMAQVLDDGEPSEAFPVTNGVKQGCVLAPTLFSLMFSAMLTDAFR